MYARPAVTRNALTGGCEHGARTPADANLEPAVARTPVDARLVGLLSAPFLPSPSLPPLIRCTSRGAFSTPLAVGRLHY